MYYNPTQQDLNLLYQPKTNLYISIDVYIKNNTLKNLQPVANLQGELINDTFSIDADSDIRRTFHLTMFVKDSSFYLTPSSKIWIDKFIRIKIGVQDQRTKEIVYYPMGTFLFDETGYSYDAITKNLTLTCVDLMANFTGLRNGQVRGFETQIPRGSIISEEIINTVLNEGQYSQYKIDARPVLNTDNTPMLDENNNPIVYKVPHDLKFSAGSTVYDILSKLNEINAGWEMFFDVDETFVNQPIPMRESDPCVLNWQTISGLVISESISSKFSDVKNSTRVWGRHLEATRSILPENLSGRVITVVDDYDEDGGVAHYEWCYSGVLDGLIPETLPDDTPEGTPNNPPRIPDGTMIAFITPEYNNSNYHPNYPVNLEIVDNTAFPVFDNNGNVTYTPFSQMFKIVEGDANTQITMQRLLSEQCYIVVYDGEKEVFNLQGGSQIVYLVKEYNELPLNATYPTKSLWIAHDQEEEETNNIKYIINSERIPAGMPLIQGKELYYNPFAIDEVGEIRQVLEGGEYDSIYTDDLARQRAEYEHWHSIKLNYELVLKIKPVLWLDVNQKIEYKSKLTGEIKQYIIKSIEGSSMSGEMTIKAIDFHPEHPNIT